MSSFLSSSPVSSSEEASRFNDLLVSRVSLLVSEFNSSFSLIDPSSLSFPFHFLCFHCRRLYFNTPSHYLPLSSSHLPNPFLFEHFCDNCIRYCKPCLKEYPLTSQHIHSDHHHLEEQQEREEERKHLLSVRRRETLRFNPIRRCRKARKQ